MSEEPMIPMDEVQRALLDAVQPLQEGPLRAAQHHYIDGYVAALQDFKTQLSDCGVWWQRLIPREALPNALTLRMQFYRRRAAAGRGPRPPRRKAGEPPPSGELSTGRDGGGET